MTTPLVEREREPRCGAVKAIPANHFDPFPPEHVCILPAGHDGYHEAPGLRWPDHASTVAGRKP